MDPVHADAPYPPNPDIEAVDAQLAELVAARYRLVSDDLVMPSTAYVERWAEKFGVRSAVLRRVFWSLRVASLLPEAMFARRTQDPLGVVPIMRRVAWDTYQFTVTHAVQYSDSSLVSTVLVDHTGGEQSLDALLALAIESPDRVYGVHPEESHGQPPRVHQTWRVEPRLPERMDGVIFMLVPGEPRLPRWEPKPVIVPQPLTLA